MKNLYFLLLAIVAIGCEKELQFSNPDYKPKLVINGFTSVDSFINVSVSKSTSTLTQPSLQLLDGKVKVLVLKDRFLLFSDSVRVINGNVLVPFKPIEGSEYELQVGYGDLPTIRATDMVPSTRPIIRIDTLKDEGDKYRLVFFINDNIEANRYVVNLNVKGKESNGFDSLNMTYPLGFTSSDKIFLSNIRTVANGRELAIFDDETWNGTERKIEFVIDKQSLDLPEFRPKHIELWVKDISKIMYDYYIEVNSNTHVYGGPLANVSRVEGNVEQGLGAFCFYTESVSTMSLK